MEHNRTRSVVPAQRQITYDLDLDQPAPAVGQYLVSIGVRGMQSVYLIQAVRLVKPAVRRAVSVRPFHRYMLTVWPRPEMKPFVVVEPRFNTVDVWVRGEVALPCFWHSRSPKIKRERR